MALSGVVLEVNTFLKGVGSQQKVCVAVNLFTQTLYVYLRPGQLIFGRQQHLIFAYAAKKKLNVEYTMVA